MKSPVSSSFQPFWELSPRKQAFLTGTLLLTFTGILCRVLGFFYRIFMSRTIGAEGLGIYHMVHPIFSICFSLCAGSIQTALSQYTAAHRQQARRAFRSGLAIAMTLSLLLGWGIYTGSEFIARHFLLEPRCAPYLPVMAVSVPFAALHACINGYYYGMQKARIPAFAQAAEQIIRMAVVFFIAHLLIQSGCEITVSLAVFGHLIGEIASAGFTCLCLCLFPPQKEEDIPAAPGSFLGTALPLLSLALPLMGSRLVLNLLGSAEAIWIPNRLAAFGLSNSQALAVYGVLTSMALPFILFPSAIINSVAVLLLPAAAQAQAENNDSRICRLITLCLGCSCYMGILCVGIFTVFGQTLGTSVFKDPMAGTFIQVLAWLCPFMYLSTTLGSVLNGLGRTTATFTLNVCALLIRLAFVLLAVPSLGIQGCLWGMLASELALAAMCLISVRRQYRFRWNALELILKPAVCLFLSLGISFALLPALSILDPLPAFLKAAVQIGIISGCYAGLLMLLHSKKNH